MAESSEVQFITPTNRLKMKVGGGDEPMKIDPEAIKRAEKALDNLACEFEGWLQENLTQLRQTFAAVKAEDCEENRELFYAAAHDLKGLGSTLGYPLVTQIGGSLSRLIEDTSKPAAAHLPIAESHVGALAAIVAQAIQGADDPVGTQLAAELDELVHKALSS
jgi:hypothetical protein